MDVILAQLGPRELESHCRDAMKTQLMAMQHALTNAVDAAKRAEEVQLASQKLAITLFEDGSELSSTLLVSTWVKDELSQSLERLVSRVLGGAAGGVSSSKPATSTSIARAGLSELSKKTGEERPNKRSRPSSIAGELDQDPPAKSPAKKAKSASALAKALAACTHLTEELAKKKKMADRVAGLKMLVQHFNTVHKNLDRDSTVDHIEALDTLRVVAAMVVSIMQQGKPDMKRHWVQNFRDNIADIQTQFPECAEAFQRCVNSLARIINSFPLTIKEGQRLRVRLRKALDEVNSWENGQYSVAYATQVIALLAEAFECTCPNWAPRADKTVRQLATALLEGISTLKPNKIQAKRKEKLQSWLDEMQGTHDTTPTLPSPRSSGVLKQATTVKSKGDVKPQMKVKAPRKATVQQTPTLPRPCAEVHVLSPSTESSDEESTQPNHLVKVEDASR